MIYKIVQGNSFKLHILVRKPDISSESNMLIDFDMTKATDIKVSLVCNFGESTIIPAHVSMALPNVVVCEVPSTLDIGNYNVSVSWRMDGNDMASVEKNLFRIVEYNSQAQYPICMVEGENCKETKIATAIVVIPATIELWQLVNLTNATLEEADALSKKIADAEALRVKAEKEREDAELKRNKQVSDAISNINKAQANNIKKIEQTTTSIESGGINVITITTGSGTTSFEVRNGSKGDQGEKGEKGEKGEQGTQGIQGAKGDTGSQGERGLQGERGIQGERGEKGDMGSIGKISISVDNTTGTPSATATASKAADGSTDISFSFKGIKGEKGEKGERGEQGIKGEQGVKGDTGAQGEQGIQGVKGDPFTYDDFTPGEIEGLKKPATDAANELNKYLDIVKLPVMETPVSETTVAMDANKVYDITIDESLTLTLNAPTDLMVTNEYQGSFDTGATAPTVTFPADVIWAETPSVEANTHYEFNIRYIGGKYYGLVQEWNINT